MGTNDNPLVSVIVPAYNAQKYLRQCVESIISQTYTHVEAVVVDDGSTDQTSSICDALAVSDARIRVIHQRAIKVSHAPVMPVWMRPMANM